MHRKVTQPVALRGKDNVRGASTRKVVGNVAAVEGCSLGKPQPQTGVTRIDAKVRARLGIGEPDFAHIDEVILTRITDLDREHVVVAREVDELGAPIPRAPEVRDDGHE